MTDPPCDTITRLLREWSARRYESIAMPPAKILIIEDDRVVARDIRQQLTRMGHTVVGSTGRGEDAVGLALNAEPELVLMDIRLEGSVDGIDAAQQIRERCRIPVVFLTAYSDDETVKRATVTEPFGYLLKPYEDSQLRTIIDMALYKHAAERRLQESERRYATTLASIGDAVIATDNQLHVSFMNPVAEALTGWPQQDARGRPVTEVFRIVNEETRHPVEDPAAKVLRLGTVAGLANHTVLLARDGREVAIDDCGAPIIDDRGTITGTVLVFRDIAERRRTDEALRKAQADLARVARLSAMGELSISIAHEVNQPLMAIGTDAETCLVYLGNAKPNLEEARRAAERVIRGCRRAANVVASVTAFAKRSPPEMTQFDINEAITEVLDLMRAEIRRHEIQLLTEFATNLPLVTGDRTELQQVVINLLVNGIEAMIAVAPGERKLNVGSRSRDLDEVIVAVADTGAGLDPETVDRIFEPLFSTKPDGIGMGLSICRTIVERHGGRLWASANQPCGSVFQFTVRISVDGAQRERPA